MIQGVSLTANETTSAMQAIAQAQAEQLGSIQNSTAEELAKITQKYQTAESVGNGATIIAMIFVALFYLTMLLFDLLKLLPYIECRQERKKAYEKRSMSGSSFMGGTLNQHVPTWFNPYHRAKKAPIDFEKSGELKSQIDRSYYRLASAMYKKRVLMR